MKAATAGPQPRGYEPSLAMAFMVLAAMSLAAIAAHCWRGRVSPMGEHETPAFSTVMEQADALVGAIRDELGGVEPLGDISGMADYTPAPPPPEPDTGPSSDGAIDEGPAEDELLLSGISWHPQRAVAIINGRALMLHDRIRDMEVTEIGEEHVTLSNKDGETRTLRLYGKLRVYGNDPE